MKKYVLFVLLPLVLICSKGFSQASLGISQAAYTIYNDTVSAYSYDSINVYIINKGSSTFNDYFQVITAVQDSAAVTYHTVDTAYSLLPISLPPGDSIAFDLSPFYEISFDKYHYDINVIVIWPVAFATSTEDFLHINVYILLPASLQEIDLTHLIKAYPNPTINSLMLENTGKNVIEEVRIYNLQGQLIESLKKPDVVCTEKWAAGTYIINIQLENNKTHTIRVIKQ